MGAVSEIIENGYDGFIVNTNDLNQVIKKIDFITKNYYFSKKIGLRARKKIQNKLLFGCLRWLCFGAGPGRVAADR